MTLQEEEIFDNAIPALAVKALSDASKRAISAGHTIVVVKGERLIRKGPDGEEVLEVVPPRLKVRRTRKSQADE